MNSTGLDSRHRDANGEISRKHGNTLIKSLRIAYGKDFAAGCDDGQTLAEVLHKLDEPSLSKLVEDERREAHLNREASPQSEPRE
ncbi:MAG: hypothetical protein JOY67_15905 [Hyphomicrobiales bacterium]|nr:hypothetical protein [Hyphomicrobiales bacterium]